MLRKLVNWVLIKLGLKRGPAPKSALTSLLELMPLVAAVVILVDAIEYISPPEGLRKPWYRQLWSRIRFRSQYLRYRYIGY